MASKLSPDDRANASIAYPANLHHWEISNVRLHLVTSPLCTHFPQTSIMLAINSNLGLDLADVTQRNSEHSNRDLPRLPVPRPENDHI